MTHPRESDYALMERLKAGDDLAFRELYLQHYTVLCHYAASFLKDNFIAESIVSDVIFKLWEGRERLQIHSSLRVYLIIAVRNRCLNYIRDSKLFAERKVPLCEEIIERTHDVNGNPLGVLLSRELESQVMQAVDELPDKTGRFSNSAAGVSEATKRFPKSLTFRSIRSNTTSPKRSTFS